MNDSQEANANGSSSVFSLTDEGGSVNPKNTEITDAQNEKGLDREQEATFSLSRNAEYMDNAIAFNNKGGHAAPIALADAQEVGDNEKCCCLQGQNKVKAPTGWSGLSVRITYLPGQSPAKYCRRK